MIRTFQKFKPDINKKSYIDSQSCIIGQVKVCEGSSIWPFVSLRGDMNRIYIGKNSNVQDNSSLHTTFDNTVTIGDNVTIGHNCVIHGAKIGDNSLIGMGSILLDGCIIGKNCLVGAGSLITPRTVIEDESLVLGSPAKVIRKLKEEEKQSIIDNSIDYKGLCDKYLKEGQIL
ncbi:MAG: gamma carbonic anhydrase family protein [Candidatus Muirbacterium halophilum]|nr:gamma carbonic anhydrase family protein [Candidatus Muirbacterium halophilum]MCK9475997.1 gamma carbonic anhydrase family protein [Candidatus Muirbacterium halophilum]